MNKKGTLLTLCVLLLLLTGCKEKFSFLPYARELENMALMQTMGVDTGEGEDVTVTVSTGAQNQGGDQSSSQPIVLQKKGGSISGACLAMQGEGNAYLFYGHVGQLLLGEPLARRGVEEALDYVFRDVEMRLETELYLINKNTAGRAISAAAEKKSAADRLEAMGVDPGLLSYSMPRTVKEVLVEFADNGCSFAPAVRLEGEQEIMTAVGYGLMKEGKLVGWAEGESARGVNLLCGKVEADILEVELPGRGRVALRVVGAKTRVKPVFEGDKLSGLTVYCSVEANLAQGSGDAANREPQLRDQLEQELSGRTEQRIRAALALCQKLDGDFFHLENKAGRAAPWHWADIREQWEISSLPIQIEVQGTVRRGYDARE